MALANIATRGLRADAFDFEPFEYENLELALMESGIDPDMYERLEWAFCLNCNEQAVQLIWLSQGTHTPDTYAVGAGVMATCTNCEDEATFHG